MDQRWAAFCAEATWIWHQDQCGFGAIKIGDEFGGGLGPLRRKQARAREVLALAVQRSRRWMVR